MSGTYICSQCCRTAARRAARHLGQAQQQRQASSYNLDNLVTELPQSSSRYSRPQQKPNGNAPRRADSLHDYVAAASTARSSARPPRRLTQDNTRLNQSLEAAVLPPRRSRNRDASLTSYTSDLDNLVSKGDAVNAWSYFSTHYTTPDCPALDPTRLAFTDVAKHQSGHVYTRLLSLMTDRWLEQIEIPQPSSTITSPSPLDVVDKFDQLAISSPHICSRIAWSLAVQLQLTASRGVNVLEHSTTKLVFVQLMSLWPRCFFPRTDNDDVAIYRNRFLSLLSKKSDKLPDLAASILLVHDLLRRADSLPDDLEHYRPFLRALDWAASRTTLSQLQIQNVNTKLKKEVMSEVLDRVLKPDELLARLSHPSGAPMLKNVHQTPATQEASAATPETLEEKARRLVNRVGFAVEKQNLDTVERLWAEAQGTIHVEPSQSSEYSTALLRLYEAFLVAFFELRRPQSGVQVWNKMLESGLEPTVRTWNVMMKSCHISRDIDIMESMWRRMRESGLQPDVISWSTRIYGLLRIGSVREGMSALDEMGREWLNSQRQRTKPSAAAEIAEAVKPNTAILNSAISALRGKRSHHIPSILSWSRSFNIEPDVVTYNALLHVSLTEGHAEEANKILQRMAVSNVKPDSATFTVLINSMLHTSLLNDMTHSEQEDKIMQLISSFEACGLTVDVQGYALLIDRMLKEHGNVSAAQKVLKHMMARKVERTPHIYTILMTHYFDADPPNLFAADALWNDIQNSRKTTLDVIFYDRMVEGFARHGDVGRTMAFLNRMTKEGKRPGWLAMMAVVKCLAQKHEWDRVAQIVVDCHKQEGLLSVGLRGRKGQKDFWEYVGDVAANELYGSDRGKQMLAIVEAQREALGM